MLIEFQFLKPMNFLETKTEKSNTMPPGDSRRTKLTKKIQKYYDLTAKTMEEVQENYVQKDGLKLSLFLLNS